MSSMSMVEVKNRIEGVSDWEQRLVVEPFLGWDEETSGASLDFHLGNRFTIFRRRRGVQHDPVDVKKDAEATGRDSVDIATQEFYVPFGDRFVLHPGHLVLGTTLEWFRFPYDMMAYVIGRSIWGRRGLLVATATAVQPGSAGTITLELSNTGEIAVIVRPGVRIGQLFFQRVDPGLAKRKGRPFSGVLRPVLGKYVPSASESFLMGDEIL